jgi:multicomponent Na+:H+ antiporter subunit F
MILAEVTFLSISVQLALGMHCAGVLLGLIRLILGPTVPDRVVALDLIGTIVVAIIAVYAIAEGAPVYLMSAITVALTMFMGTVAIASFVQRGGQP